MTTLSRIYSLRVFTLQFWILMGSVMALVSLTSACSEPDKTESTETEVSASPTTDSQSNADKISRLEAYDYSELNALVKEVNPKLNPFTTEADLAEANFQEADCEDSLEPILCVLSSFAEIDLPLHFGPHPEINYTAVPTCQDSIFIVNALRDSLYYSDDPDNERMYGYRMGISINHSGDFYAVVIPKSFGVGKEYILWTFSREGKYIDHLLLGEEAADYQSVFGRVESLDSIVVTTKEFGYDEEKNTVYFASSQTQQYSIDDEGKIHPKTSDSNSENL
ncbi:MAG: hypothetical protein SchgKO_10650 [Schleiferiaceae bacterium]